MHKLMGLIVIAGWMPLKYIPPPSRLNVKAIVFLCFGSSTFCGSRSKRKKEFPQVEVGSLDCHSLLEKHFVFQILE